MYQNFRRQLLDEFRRHILLSRTFPRNKSLLSANCREAAPPSSVVHRSSGASPPGTYPTNNLLLALTDFIGREKEIAEAGARLAECRMLTLRGREG